MTGIIFSGFGGQGILTTGIIAAEAGMKLGKHITWYPSYGAQMRGGTRPTAIVLLGDLESEVLRYLMATIAASVLSEICARVLKAPAAIFLIIGIIPLVPGGGLYYAMDHLINGDFTLFAQQGIRTAAYAGAIAMGVSMVSSLARIVTWKRRPGM